MYALTSIIENYHKMEKIEFIRFIERYLEDKMQPAEKAWFEKELDGNMWLKRELELRRKTDLVASNTEAMDFRKKLMQAEARHRQATTVKRAVKSVKTVSTRYAAAILGIVIISSIFLFSNRDINPRKLASKSIASYEPGTASRSSSSVSDINFNRAVECYNNGEYIKAIDLLEGLISSQDNNSIKSDYLLGISHMKIEEYKEAISPFKKVVDQNDNLFIEQAKWYLSICYLNTNETEKAKELLTEIKNSDSKYRKLASKNLKKLN